MRSEDVGGTTGRRGVVAAGVGVERAGHEGERVQGGMEWVQPPGPPCGVWQGGLQGTSGHESNLEARESMKTRREERPSQLALHLHTKLTVRGSSSSPKPSHTSIETAWGQLTSL